MIYGALLSSDPGDIHDTINNLIADKIRVSMVGLAAQVAICAELCSRTNGGNDGCYSVAKDEDHFRELFLLTTTPPPTLQAEQSSASLLMMGFPSRTKTEPFVDPNRSKNPADPKKKKRADKKDAISFCACHHKPCREGYLCTRCTTKVCRLPAECPACGLTLILSTHLARSYHHLFPLRNWVTVPWRDAHKSTACHACLNSFPPPPSSGKPSRDKDKDRAKGKEKEKPAAAAAAEPPKPATVAATAEQTKDLARISESGRYACEVCGNHFCIDCDVFAHEVVHNCPGCQSDTRAAARAQAQVEMEMDAAAAAAAGAEENGVTRANGEMIVDS